MKSHAIICCKKMKNFHHFQLEFVYYCLLLLLLVVGFIKFHLNANEQLPEVWKAPKRVAGKLYNFSFFFLFTFRFGGKSFPNLSLVSLSLSVVFPLSSSCCVNNHQFLCSPKKERKETCFLLAKNPIYGISLTRATRSCSLQKRGVSSPGFVINSFS